MSHSLLFLRPKTDLRTTLRSFLALILSFYLAVAAASGANYPKETWLGMYLGKLKLGFTVINVDKVEFNGKPAIKVESTAKTEMIVLGSKMIQNIRTTIYSDLNTQPVYEEFRMSSGGKTTLVTADFKKDQILCRLMTDAGESKKSIPIPAGTQLIGDSYTPITGGKLTVGLKFNRKSFNPLTLALDDLNVSVDREETLDFGGKKVKAIVITTKTPMADLTTYQSIDDDETLKIEAPMGISMVRETREAALGIEPGEYHPPQDFAVLTSVRANVDLPVRGQLKRLQIRLSGIPAQFPIISDDRQKATSSSGADTRTVTYVIHAAEFDSTKAVSLPITTENVKQNLSASAYVESDSPEVIQRAKQVIGNETNVYKAAQRIRKWVNKLMKPKGDMGILRPATDVLKNPSGVCRDYTVLFAAIARAAGIPTRITGGLVFARGDFYYHAWNEVWTGASWVPFDSTLTTDFVDATHIKLTEGDVTDMYRMGKIIGQLKAEIVTYQ